MYWNIKMKTWYYRKPMFDNCGNGLHRSQNFFLSARTLFFFVVFLQNNLRFAGAIKHRINVWLEKWNTPIKSWIDIFLNLIINGNLSPSSQMNWISFMSTGNVSQRNTYAVSQILRRLFQNQNILTQEPSEYAHKHNTLITSLFTAIFIITGLTLFVFILTAL